LCAWSGLSDKIDVIATDISGLDELLGGGIPKGHTVSVFGGPGAGKTTFAIQFLYNGATLHDEPGLYISLDEPPVFIKKYLSQFGWNLYELEEKNKLVFLDVSPFEHFSGIVKIGDGTGDGSVDWKRHFSVSSLNNAIKTVANKIEAKRIVVDPLSTLLFHYPDPEARRTAIMDLIRTLRGETDCTSLLVLDLRTAAIEREYQLEEYLTQGTILFQTMTQPETGLIRVMLIEKMRGVDHDTQPHPYRITKKGIQVLSKLKCIQ